MKETTLSTVRHSENVIRPFKGNISANRDQALLYQDTVKDLNAKIQKIKLMIAEQFPELTAIVNEVPEIVVDDNFEDTRQNRMRLKKRYESLDNLLTRYKLERHFKSK